MKKYFVFVGGLFNLAMLFSILLAFHYIYSSGLSLPVFSDKVTESIVTKQPNLYRLLAPALNTLGSFEVENYYFRTLELSKWSGAGASDKKKNRQSANIISIVNTVDLIAALKNAEAGQTIMLAPGEYHMDTNRVVIGKSGTAFLPIHLTAKILGTVKIFLKGEGFVVNKPYWQFSNLHFIGNCKSHTQCEHAFHVVGKGQHAIIDNNILQDFNAMIKVNGIGENYPDYGKVIDNTFFNTSPRETSNPVTPFDLMHANHWQVSDNFIFDIQKSSGDKVSYAAFFKGGSEFGVFERNLIMCAANLPDDNTAIGLSLGGGGSLKRHRRNQNSAEHSGGIIRHNIIMHCANDVGIYLNRARDSLIEHNTLYNTLGIDIRYVESDAIVANNILSGRIKLRDKAKMEQRNNFIISRDFVTGSDKLSDYFVAPDIGDFSWKEFSNHHLSSKKSLLPILDFCQDLPTKPYIGAYSSLVFCTDKLNLNINKNSEFIDENTQ